MTPLRSTRLRRPARRPRGGTRPITTPVSSEQRRQQRQPGVGSERVPAQVRLCRHRRRMRRGPGQPRQHQALRRPCGRDRPGGRGSRHADPDRGQRGLPRPAPARQVRQRHPRGDGRVRPLWEASLFEEHGFTDFKISVKHHDPRTMISAYRLLAKSCDHPLHLRRHRGRSGRPGCGEVGGRLRHPAGRGHRRHHPGLPVRPAGRGGEGRS